MGLQSLAVLYEETGDCARGRATDRQALETVSKSWARSIRLAANLKHLAMFYKYGDYAKAEPLFDRHRTFCNKSRGKRILTTPRASITSPRYTMTWGTTRRPKPLYRQAMEIRKQVLGEKHPDYAMSLKPGPAIQERGGLCEGRATLPAGIGYYVQALGKKHPLYATSLNDLAGNTHSMGDYAKAEPLFRQALEIRKQVLGEKSDYATSLHNLAGLHESMGDYAQAALLLQQALDIFKQVLGEKHPKYATSINNLAELYSEMGDYAKAEPLYRQALEIRKQALGKSIPCTPRTSATWPCCTRRKAMEGGNRAPQHARRVVRRHVARVLPSLNEKEQVTFLQTTDAAPFHCSLSLGLTRRDDPLTAELSAAWLLNGKAVIHETLAERARLTQESHAPETAEIAHELTTVRSQLARLSLTIPKPDQQAQYQQQVGQLSRREEELSRRLAAASGTQYREESRGSNWRRSKRPSPPSPSSWKSRSFDVFNFQALGKEKKFLPAHYAAWIIPTSGHGEVTIVDVGEADKVDKAVTTARQALLAAVSTGDQKGLILQQGEPKAEKAMQQALADVARLVFAPLVPHFGKADRLIISPDAALWLIPWGALPVGENQYAIEKYKISYVVTGRDLVIKPGSVAKTTEPVIFADPNYDLGPAAAQAAARTILRGNQLAGGEPFRGFATGRSIDALRHAPRLAGTAAEAEAITPNLEAFCHKAPVVYQDQYALKAVFKELHGPKAVVLSTHGFFLEDQHVETPLVGNPGNPDTGHRPDRRGHASGKPLAPLWAATGRLQRRGPEPDGRRWRADRPGDRGH